MIISYRKSLDERRRTVTLIAGMVCKDGIVMAADSEQSGYFRKSNVPKLESFQPSGIAAGLLGGPPRGCSVIIAGAGNGELADYASHKIVKEAESLSDMKDIEAKIEEILVGIFSGKLQVYKASDMDEFRLLIAVKAQDVDKPRLFSTYGSTLVERKKFVLGSGALVDYILDQIYDEAMLTEDGMVAALSLLQVAKKYVGGVGGDSKLTVLTNEGRVRNKPSWEVYREEGIIEEHSKLASKLMLSMMRTRTDSEQEWKDQLAAFAKGMEELREKKKSSDEIIKNLFRDIQAQWAKEKEERDREEAKQLPYLLDVPATNLFRKEGNVFTGKSLPNAKVVGKLAFKNG
jgi:20S proteasome alpha/beta subunit